MGSATKTKTRNRPATRADLDILRASVLADLSWLVHGFSTRQGGFSTCYGEKTLNLGVTPHDRLPTVERNRALFLCALGATDTSKHPWPLLQVKQIHASLVRRVDANSHQPLSGDGLISNTPGRLLAIKTADCVPVLVADSKRKVIGAFHAGWRGTVARIVQKGIGEMRREFGSEPRDLRAAIGPCIRSCCYVIGDEVRAEFESQFSYADELFHEVFNSNALSVRYPLLFLNQRAPGHGEAASETHLDLVEANRRQLQDAGVRNQSIEVVGGCTACDTTKYFSHRAEHGDTGRMMAAIGIKPE